MRSSYQVCSLLIAAAAVVSANPPLVISTVVDNFRWKDPFGSYATPPGFRETCEVSETFKAHQISLHDLQEPPPLGLAPWVGALKFFFGGRPFPGSWDGVDNQELDRDVIVMEYADVPRAVKIWIEEQAKDKESENRYLFAVYKKPSGEGEKITQQSSRGDGEDKDKIILFAAGAIYETLPLWVAEAGECQVPLLDLSLYKPDPADGGVVAWVLDRTQPDRASGNPAITFRIKAQVLKEEAPTVAEEKVHQTKDAAETPTPKAEADTKYGKDEL